jgi:hypothetical protein
MAWWPHAIIHGINPIWTRAVWAPTGYNLAWATGAPGPALLVSPITLTAGPVASYNVLALLAAPLAGTTAYLLCRHLTGRLWPSLLGGYVFGFSTYMVAHVGLQVNLELVFLVPLAIHLVLLRLKRAIGSRAFVAALMPLLIAQFLISTEVFATLAVFGAITLAIAFPLVDHDQRRTLLSSGGQIALSFLLAAALVAPYLYYVFAHGIPHRQPIGADLLSFFVPRTLTLIRSNAFNQIASRFPGSLRENTAYLGPPLVLIILMFVVTRWRTRTGRLLLSSLLVVVLATLGETLYVGGRPTIPLPWRAIGRLPLLDNAFARRFTMYVFLVLAVVVATWLTAAKPGRASWALALLVPVFLFPGPALIDAHGHVDIPRFFETGIFHHYIRPGDTVLLELKSASDGTFPQARSMVIQAQTGFSFRMVVAYTGPQPPEYHRSLILQFLTKGMAPPVSPAEFTEFLRSHQVSVIVLDRHSDLEPSMTALAGRSPLAVEDVLIYRMGPSPRP